MQGDIIAEFYRHDRPVIPVGVVDGYGNMRNIDLLVDSGNDRTMISMDVAESLGFDLTNAQTAQVQGVFYEPQQVYILRNVTMQIGNTRPISLDIYVAETDMNLLGMADISRVYKILIEKDMVTFIQEEDCDICTPLDGDYRFA